jgi:hypothetical protein
MESKIPFTNEKFLGVSYPDSYREAIRYIFLFLKKKQNEYRFYP